MNSVFSQTGYLIRRQGLSISGKYQVLDLTGKNELLYVEVKSKLIPASITINFYLDKNKKQAVLTMKDRPNGGFEEMDVFDAESNTKIGGLEIGADKAVEIFKDMWNILDVEDKPIGKIYEKNLGKSLARTFLSHDIPQNMTISIGDQVVGELKQKLLPIRYELVLDFSQDVTKLLDHRLGIASGMMIAYHQGNEIDF